MTDRRKGRLRLLDTDRDGWQDRLRTCHRTCHGRYGALSYSGTRGEAWTGRWQQHLRYSFKRNSTTLRREFVRSYRALRFSRFRKVRSMKGGGDNIFQKNSASLLFENTISRVPKFLENLEILKILKNPFGESSSWIHCLPRVSSRTTPILRKCSENIVSAGQGVRGYPDGNTCRRRCDGPGCAYAILTPLGLNRCRLFSRPLSTPSPDRRILRFVNRAPNRCGHELLVAALSASERQRCISPPARKSISRSATGRRIHCQPR